MINMNAYRILNDVDKEYFSLYVEWFDSQFKIVLLKSAMTPLSGEMTTAEINHIAGELFKSSEQYLYETKEIFCGKDPEIKFFIHDGVFEWKTKLWTLGRITLHPITDIGIISEILRELLSCHQDVREKFETLQRENVCLRDAKIKLSTDIEEMINIKASMEQELYKRFLLLLNSKKKKIRELQKALKERGAFQDTVFDASTDESSTEEDNKISNIFMQPIKARKRKVLKRHGTNVRKIRKSDSDTYTDSDTNDQMSPQASTSKDFVQNISKNDTMFRDKGDCEMQENSSHTTKKSRSSLSFLEEKSEDELFDIDV